MVNPRQLRGRPNLLRPFLVALLAGCTGLTALGQYAIDWFKISGAGGSSSNGSYTINGTIGQHDAGGPMSGGAYSVVGGFWALSAVQATGAPLLSIFLTPTNTAIIFWPSPSTGFGLQQNVNLSTTNWVTPSESVNDDGVNRFIIVNPPADNRYYRLQHP